MATVLLTPYYGVVYFFSLLMLFENTVKHFLKDSSTVLTILVPHLQEQQKEGGE